MFACSAGSSTMGGTLLWLCALTSVSWEVVSSQDSVYHNVALGAQATSTVITDGNKDTCLPMNWKTTDILQVYLVNSTAVHAVSIVWNINNFFYITPVASIHVGDSLGQQGSNNTKCQDIKMDQGSSMSTYNCGGINGRYVTLNLDSIATSYICEIMVSATPLKEGTQVLMYGVASQSSKVAPGAGPWKALDSRVDNASAPTLCMASTAVTAGHGCSITYMDWEPWWRLDMMLLYRVKSVTIAGRGDINGLRLFGAEIRVGNSVTREDNGIAQLSKEWSPHGQPGRAVERQSMERTRIKKRPPAEMKSARTAVKRIVGRCDQDIFVTSGQSMEFHCPPWLVGRFLTVALPGRVDSLGLCEVSLLANPMLKSSIFWKNGIISTSDSTTPY
ncbi:uncharacterized protein LOC133347807 [Lethenteron reissneri]|uniref:uncharacterized protein LOC133347807 n=1 Tax=Lethenteron reissneri TaxID=7753 RepID=UPI002AB723B4|nr:uncharacterized protein LOC133347807 [Lethenteron reissneri]